MSFPENIKTDGSKVIWLDDRVNGELWRGTFYKIKAIDQIRDLGPPPGV